MTIIWGGKTKHAKPKIEHKICNTPKTIYKNAKHKKHRKHAKRAKSVNVQKIQNKKDRKSKNQKIRKIIQEKIIRNTNERVQK